MIRKKVHSKKEADVATWRLGFIVIVFLIVAPLAVDFATATASEASQRE